MRKIAAVVAAGLALATTLAPTSHAQVPEKKGTQVILSGPGEGLPPGRDYATPVAVTEQGGSFTYINGDAINHDVVAIDAFGAGDQEWCQFFPEGRCPLFWTPLIGVAKTTPVRGIEQAPPGTYTFGCTIHGWMEGQIIVLEETS